MENEEHNSADDSKQELENKLEEKTLTEDENPSDLEEVQESPSKRQKVEEDQTEKEAD